MHEDIKVEETSPISRLETKRRAIWTFRCLLGLCLSTSLSGCIHDYSLKNVDEGNTDGDNAPDTGGNTDPDCDDGAKDEDASGLTWVTICGGTFEMGAATGDEDERPVHRVEVRTYELLETEVTVAQYLVCVQADSCTQPQSEGTAGNWGKADRENYPINNVTWYQAEDFCTWAGGRLPSEAEWEYAASNGDLENEFPWGNNGPTCSYAIMDDGGDGCGTGQTGPVCSRPQGNTTHGLCDMAGNVWEWVQDWHHSNYIGAPLDGTAWVDPSGTVRVRRGGAYYNLGGGMRASQRSTDAPTVGDDYLGFRCAR